MLQRNLLYNEIQSLISENEWEFEAKGKPVAGRVAWAKESFNKLLGTSLPINNQADESFRKILTDFQQTKGLETTSKLDFKTERRLLEESALKNLSPFDFANRVVITQAKSKIEDWTHKAIIPKHKKHLILNDFRDPRTLTALVLHHMAYKAKDAHGNYSNPESYLKVGAHFCIMRDGRIMQHHPASRFIWHSQCTSPRSVGVEFEGNFPDIRGKWWYPTDEKTKKKIKINEDIPTQEQYESGRFLLKYLKLILNLKHVLAHRQSSKDRENDPGPDIWFNVGEWGLANLGLSDGGANFKCGDGNPILTAWRNAGKTARPKTSPSPTSTARVSAVNSSDDSVLTKINKYSDLIEAASKKYGLPSKVIKAIIAAESGGDPNKTSAANYKGLMQAERSDDQYQPAVSIEAGTKKFAAFKNNSIVPRLAEFGVDARRIDEKNLLSLIVASYNAGPVTVLKALQYAHQAGDWKKWLEAEHYQRALAFSGGYHTYESCSKNYNSADIKEARKKRLEYAGWRSSKTDWKKYPDPPALKTLEQTAPKLMMCWVKTKHKNTPGYINKFLKYI